MNLYLGNTDIESPASSEKSYSTVLASNLEPGAYAGPCAFQRLMPWSNTTKHLIKDTPNPSKGAALYGCWDSTNPYEILSSW